MEGKRVGTRLWRWGPHLPPQAHGRIAERVSAVTRPVVPWRVPERLRALVELPPVIPERIHALLTAPRIEHGACEQLPGRRNPIVEATRPWMRQHGKAEAGGERLTDAGLVTAVFVDVQIVRPKMQFIGRVGEWRHELAMVVEIGFGTHPPDPA